MTTAEQIALSAEHAAWLSAAASSCASIVALSIAVLSSRRDERRRLQAAREQERAFCFAMVGALEMVKPIILRAHAEPHAEIDRRSFSGMVDHAHMIAEAGLAIPIFDMQLLRDAYQLRGALNYLRSLTEDRMDAVPHMAITGALRPLIDQLIDADVRFSERLPELDQIKGSRARTQLSRVNDLAQ